MQTTRLCDSEWQLMGTDFKTATELRAFYSWLEPESGLDSLCDGLTPVAPATTSQDLYMLQEKVE